MKRNIILSLSCAALMFIIMPACAQKANQLTSKERKEGWVLLFNGKDFSGWRQCNGTAMPANWIIEDNAMKVFTGEGRKPGQGANGDILFSDKKFKNFELVKIPRLSVMPVTEEQWKLILKLADN